MNFKDILIKIVSVILIITLFITSYIAFVTFFCCSLQMLISYFVSFITCGLIKQWIEFANIILWVLFSVPLIHLTLGINIKILFSYFNNIWNVLSFNGIQNTIKSDFDKGKCSRTINIIKYIVIIGIIFFLGTFLVIELFTSSDENVYSYYIGIISCIPPVYGFLKVIFKSAYSLFVNPANVTLSLNNINEIKDDINPDSDEKAGNEEENNDSTASNTKTKKRNAQQSLMDPCGIMNQTEYLNFINDSDVNHFASAVKTLTFDVKMIPGLIVSGFVFTYVIVNTYSFIKNKSYKVGQLIAAYILRVIFYLFSIPFLMIFNFVGIFMDSQATKEKHSFIRKLWIFVVSFYCVFIALAVIVLSVISSRYKPFQLDNFVYNPSFINSSKKVLFSRPAAICDTKLHEMNLLQYAGIASLGQSKNRTLNNEILKYLFDGQVKPYEFYESDISFAYQVQVNNNLSVVAFNALIDKDGISFLLENYFNDFILYKLYGSIVPFYTIAHDFFLSRFLNILSERLSLYMGSTQVTPRYIDFNIEIFNKLKGKTGTTIYTGHSIGGILAKSIGDSYNVPSVAFESLNYYRSLFHASMEIYTGESMFTTNGFEMINSYSPSQLFATSEANATMNIKLPKWKSYLDNLNPYETMCTIAAGCATDLRFDDFCNVTIGMKQYLHLFTLWNRTRTNLN